ncbi:arylsulfotransferase [Kipferlia bialata]|uniref:Arylsulfotransferase n=1 Tax=Kipferlia bialata TaxID=797122 RepID=A0A9K3GG98_9EUKA|nr:arylsulfotransferase [Kipferlia bialata]|eukprot:g2829.t1
MILLVLALLLAVLVGGIVCLCLYGRFKPSPYLVEFRSPSFASASSSRGRVGDTGLLTHMECAQTLSEDLADVYVRGKRKERLRVYVSPAFDPRIRRYSYSPYRLSDKLSLSLAWSADVTQVTVDGMEVRMEAKVELLASNHGHEVEIVGRTADGRQASYSVVIMPWFMQPICNEVHQVDQVAPGIMTGRGCIACVQEDLNTTDTDTDTAPGIMTGMSSVCTVLKPFGMKRMLWNMLNTVGFRGLLRILKSRRNSPFMDIGDPLVQKYLDPNRVYCPGSAFVLDMYGTPLQYTTRDLRMITIPYALPSGTGGTLVPETGFLYNTPVQDDLLNFAEAPSRTFIANRSLEGAVELPRVLEQHDDSHELFITPRGTLMTTYYRMYEKGHVLNNGETLDLAVTSCYLVERDTEGQVVWEWDSIDHIYPDPDPAVCYQPTEGFNYHDYFHCNGARFNETDPNEMLITGRYLRGCISVDYTTGAVNWILANPSNPLNQFTFVNDPLEGPGSCHAGLLNGNTLLLFDNGDYLTPEYKEGEEGCRLFGRAPTPCVHTYSRMVEYTLDIEARTATYVREDTCKERMARIAGYIERVPRPDGQCNVCVTWGSAGTYTERAPDHTLALTLSTEGLNYRIYKTDPDYWYQAETTTQAI